MYLICFEIDRSGFILEGFRDLEMAMEVAEKVFLKINNSIMVKDQEGGAMEMMEWVISYRIKGNMSYHWSKSAIGSSSSNGVMSYYIIDSEKEDFDLQLFIRERENSSWVFSLDDVEECEYLAEMGFELFFAN